MRRHPDPDVHAWADRYATRTADAFAPPDSTRTDALNATDYADQYAIAYAHACDRYPLTRPDPVTVTHDYANSYPATPIADLRSTADHDHSERPE